MAGGRNGPGIFEIGCKRNTHFPMSDLNNHKVADLLSDWIKEKGLNKN